MQQESAFFRVAQAVFALCVCAMGVNYLNTRGLIFSMAIVPAWIRPEEPLGHILGWTLIALGIPLLFAATRKIAAALLIVLLLAGVSLHFLQFDSMMVQVTARTRVLVDLAIASSTGIILTCAIRRPRLLNGIRLLFAVLIFCLGMQHLLSGQELATAVPTWVHDPRLWVLGTGLCMVLASMAYVLQIAERPVALAQAAMFLGWALLLHLPNALTKPEKTERWGGLIVAVLMAAASVMMAETAPSASIYKTRAPHA